MRRLRRHHRQRPSVLPQLRPQALIRPSCLLALLLALFLALPGAAAAAEVLQVQGGRVLRIGDRNRVYGVELACLAVDPGREPEATAWLRQALPRRSRVNLRPAGGHDGLLVAHVVRLEGNLDLGEGLIAAGLAHPADCS
ncbi:MAG: hypothetical protein VKI81_03840 [Synechococcaceae cyanobacterium]|nr:hypothetical protein [Synechococcaceae cyanobacterium]